MPMVILIKEIGLMARNMDKESMSIQMAIIMKETGNSINLMELVLCPLPMKINIMGVGIKARKVEQGNIW
jgi:hypothetical protein